MEPGRRQLAGPGRHRDQQRRLRGRRLPGRGHRLAVRHNLAAFRASDGALLDWNPDADYNVWALANRTTARRSSPAARSQNVGGQPAYGLAKIDAATGVLDTGLEPDVNNAGAGRRHHEPERARRLRLRHRLALRRRRQPAKATFKARRLNAATGDVAWVTDCHGDNYSAFLQNGVVYAAEPLPLLRQHGRRPPAVLDLEVPERPGVDATRSPATSSTTRSATRTGTASSRRRRWSTGSRCSPRAPSRARARRRGTSPATTTTSCTAASSRRSTAPPSRVWCASPAARSRRRRRDRASPTTRSLPTLVPTSPTSVRVSWEAGFDYDDQTLTYQVFRNNVLRYTTDAQSQWWNLPSLGFVDTGLTPGQSYNYRISVRDSDNHLVNGATASVTMPASVATNPYADQVRADGARLYWPLNEPARRQVVRDRAGSAAASQRIGVSDGTADSGVTWGQTGAIAGDTAARLSTDNGSSRIFAERHRDGAGHVHGPGVGPHRQRIRPRRPHPRLRRPPDRRLRPPRPAHLHERRRPDHVRRRGPGRLAAHGLQRTLLQRQPVAPDHRDDEHRWHEAVRRRRARRPAQRHDRREDYLGYWRVGGDNLGWPNEPSNNNFVGDVDEVAIYPTALTQDQIIDQFSGERPHARRSRRSRPTPTAPPSTRTTPICTGASLRPVGRPPRMPASR